MKIMKLKGFIVILFLLVAGLQTTWAQGFRVYKSDGTMMQFSMRTDSIVFYEGIGSEVDFGPYTPINQYIVGTWYMTKYVSITFNEDGTTDYIDGATYKFLPYQGSIIIYNANGAPVNILKVHDLTDSNMIVSALGSESFCVLSTTRPVLYVTDIALNEKSILLQPDGTKRLTATVEPSDADNPAVTWESSDEKVATVINDGLVLAVADGTCIVTCRAIDGSGVYAECHVRVGLDSGTTDGHSWVDLGLPSGTLWATCNIGANSSEGYGHYYAWGETEPKSNYDWSTYKWCKGSNTTITKYCTDSIYGYNGFTDNLTELLPEDDAAAVNWGNKWQIPNDSQYLELFISNYTTTTWTMQNGVNGLKITSKSNGKSIFLPAAGYYNGTNLNSKGSNCIYWSRSLKATESNCAYHIDNVSIIRDGRLQGMSIRPVRVLETFFDWGVYADCQISINNILVTGITISQTSLSLTVGSNKTLTATVQPSDATNKNVTWSSSNTSVATVDQTGKVTAKAAGSCTITCSATDDSNMKATCQVSVSKKTNNSDWYEHWYGYGYGGY